MPTPRLLPRHVVTLAILLAACVGVPLAWAQTATPTDAQVPDAFFRARVLEVVDEVDDDPYLPLSERFSQAVQLRLLNGSQRGQTVRVRHVPGTTPDGEQKLRVGETVIAGRTTLADGGGSVYYVVDRYRIWPLVGLAVVFFALVVFFGGRRGLRSLLGLAFTVLVVGWWLIPRIVAGAEPMMTSLIGALVIAVVSLYLAHGLTRRTSVALAATLSTIVLATLAAVAAVRWARLFGLGSEEAAYVQLGFTGAFDARGLLLGGIIIGALGVLDDITTAQAAAVEELHHANPTLNRRELYHRGLSVGREHITALVNTLVLAYVGASFPLLLLFTQGQQPLWLVLNSELVAEEIVRTLVGSSALMAAVPITTALAARVFGRSQR